MGVDALLIRIRTQATERAIRVTDHAREEMEEESITLAEVLEAIANGQILENYPDHKRGSCFLLYGLTAWKASFACGLYNVAASVGNNNGICPRSA